MRARPSILIALLASTALIGVGTSLAQAQGILPQGGTVVSGGVNIGTPQGGALSIIQSSQSAIVNWRSFSIGQPNRVDIHQPNSQAAILNRVTGQTRSTIAGQLNANGQVYLVNPNGISISRTGRVNAGGGFVASTLGLSDEDFKAGRRQFRGGGASASVTNQGSITIGRGGYAALIGGRVANSGTISVPMGRVGLGSGERATLDLSGDGFLQVQIPTNAKGRGALVANTGVISADGGSVMLSAAAARDMARQSVNLTGTIEARTVSGHNGSITLSGGEGAVRIASTARLDASGAGGENGGRVRISSRQLDVAGTVDVAGARGGRVALRGTDGLAVSGRVLAQGTTGKGGRVTATAPAITTHAALIDASGATGGGSVKVGGGYQGGGRLAHAKTVDIDAASTIRADSTAKGTGGTVVVWSDGATNFAGTITARGGARGGDGGNAEVSSKGDLAYTGSTDLTAPRGAMGNLLLDPYNITITTGADSNQAGFAATGPSSTINSTTLLTALGTANVTVSTGAPGSAGAQAGTITLATGTPLSWNTGATLTLQAASAVTLNSAISAPAGGLTISAGTGTTSTSVADISVARFTLAAGNWQQNSATLSGFSTADFQITGGSFLRATGGAGTVASPYQLVDIYGVQGIGSSAALLAASYQLTGNIDASGTATWNAGAGLRPVGLLGTPFTGALNGAGNTISGLVINQPSTYYVGLVGYLDNGGRISNLGLLGGSVSSADTAGALVGYLAAGATVSNAYATGTVSGRIAVGGLVAFNYGTVTNAYATGAVSGANLVGGLIGTNQGTVSNAYATGAVSGSAYQVGGLIGANSGTVTNVYATGSSSGGSYVGGLMGYNSGPLRNAYATGAVSGSSLVGGLIGYNSVTLTGTYWDAGTSGQGNGVGSGTTAGATGLTTAQARTAASYTGFDFTTTWYQAGDMRPILRSEAAPAGVDGVIPVGNLHQLQLMGANLSATYRITGNIDASPTNSTAASAGIWGAGGFVPVGDSALPFLGTLDGANRTITGLVINRPTTDYVGLFGLLGISGSVGNVGLVGGSVSGNNSVGALVGINSGGTITRARATGSVSGGGSNVGGLVGENAGTINQSYATGAVSGASEVGGLAGYNSSSISQSYASGTVDSSGRSGGLVGVNAAIISQSYALGAVSGFVNSGGLVGFNAGTIDQAYASGFVGGSGFRGGVAGYNEGALTNTFWDTGTTGRGVGVDAGSTTGATGLSTAAARSNGYAGFDFTNVWYQAADLRPILRSEAAPAVGGVIAVSNLRQLQLMGANLAGSYRLTGPLDASPTNSTAASPGIWGAGGFVPVGNGVTRFAGAFNGAGNTITGLVVNRSSMQYAGLIGQTDIAGTISGVGLVGGSIAGDTYTGGLVGFNRGSVSLSYSTASVNGGNANYVGGLVGQNSGSISLSYAAGSVSGQGPVGGLVGYNLGTVSQAYATGSVTGSGPLGGVAGYNFGTITQTYATGSLSGTGQVGGLIGFNDGALASSYWDTSTTGRTNAAGLTSSRATTSATGRTTAQMQDLTAFRTNYAGFDFAGVWSPPNQVGQNNGSTTAYYPQLYTLSNVVAVTPSATRVYGSGSPISSAATRYTGVQAGDFVTSLGSFTAAAVATSDVGTYAISGSGTVATSAAGRVYRYVYAPGTLTVTPATITVTGTTAVSKTYDGTTALPAGQSGFNSSGVLFGDAVTVSAAAAAYGSPNAGNQSVLVSGLALGGAKAGNYVLSGTSVTGSGTIVPALLTVTGSKTYDAVSGFVTAQLAVAGGVNGEVVTLTAGSGTAPSANVGTYANGTLSGLAVSVTGGNARASNYQLPATGTLAITPATLVYTAAPASRTYGAANPALTGTVSGFVSGQTQGSATTGALAFSTGASTNSNVGSYAVTGSGLAANNGNYVFVQAPANSTALTVVPAPLTVSGTKIYDATTGFSVGQLAVSGGVNGETVALTAGSGTASAADAGVYANAALSGLAVSVTGGNGLASNYQLPTNGALTIAARPITVTADSQGRVYGDANPALTYTVGGSGLVNGDTLTGGLATSATATSPVGSYAITQGSLAASSNYSLSYTGNTLTVGQRPITVTADAQNRVYGDANPALTYAVGGRGLVNGDTLTGGLATSAAPTSNVGSYAITQGSLAASANYAVSYVGANLTVSARPITVTADAQGRAYGDANPALTYAVGGRGLVNGDTLTGGLATNATATSPVGAYAITQGSLTASANYRLSYIGNTLTVGQRSITVAGTSGVDKTYDGTTALPSGAAGYTVSGVLSADASQVSVSASSAAYDSPNVGNRTVQVAGLTLTGAAAGNYVLSSTSVTGSGTISPATLTYVANAASRTYGGANPALSGTVTGFVNGESQGSATTGMLAFATGAGTGSNVGAYAITGSGLSANNGNYAFVQAASNASALTITPAPLTVTGAKTYDASAGFVTGQLAVAGAQNGESVSLTQGTGTAASASAGTYAGSPLSSLAIQITGGNAQAANYSLPTTGTLTITPAPVTVTANSGSAVYGDTPTNPGLSASGLQGGQSVTVLTGLSSSFGLTAASNAGSYALTVAGSLTNGNYTLAARDPGNFTITPRPFTITADVQTRVYGDPNRALTYAIGGRGLVNGDTLAGGLATSAGIASGIGAYAITQGTLAASNNYAVSYVGAALTITARSITVAADAQSRAYGDANPALTYTIGGRGLVNGDTLTGGLATTATASSAAGAYPITPGSLAASANYSLTYLGADLTVLPAIVPPPVPPVLVVGSPDAAELASTAERDVRFNATPGEPLPEIAVAFGTDGRLLISDPRFDRPLACLPVPGTCYLAPVNPATQPPAGATLRPQASVAGPGSAAR